MRKFNFFLKRTFDICVSLVMIVLLTAIPVLILVPLAIKLTSKGPVMYNATRIGKDMKPFKMYKFRTMRPDAEKVLAQLKEKNEMDGPVFKIKDDPRITRVGKVLRKLSLDELMQFFNVLKGDMTLVGPRPPLPREVEFYTDYQKLRLIVTPGITCTWQIHENRNDVPFEQWVEMDLEYIQNRTFLGDLLIMLKTPFVMLSGTGR